MFVVVHTSFHSVGDFVVHELSRVFLNKDREIPSLLKGCSV